MSDLMGKIGALLMKAESTDSEHERDALMSKAQELATIASIDLEVARNKQKDKHKREQVTSKHITLFEWGDRSRTKPFFVQLMTCIGHANDVRFTIAHNSMYVNAYGFPSDIEVTEALYNSLSVQMVDAAERYLKTKEYRNDTIQYETYSYWGPKYEEKPMDGRTARRSFYTAFRSEVTSRLMQARKDAADSVEVTDDDGSVTSGALVLASKSEEVDNYYRENNNARGTYRGSGYESRGRGTQNAGRTAGSRASLGGGASIGGNRGAINA
jgi:hypothetical protein